MHFKRRKFIVDRKFQWMVIGYTFVISMMTTAAHLVIEHLHTLQKMQELDGLKGSTVSPALVMWIFVVLFNGAIFFVALIFSNRLAGPLFRMRKHMEKVAGGEKASPIYFRKADCFLELNDAYNKLIAKLPGEKGFSMMELVVVLGILSIAMAFATFQFEGPQESVRFQEDVTHLQDILQSARNAAVTKNECAFVTIADPQTVTVNTYPITSPCTALLPASDMLLTQTFPTTTSVSLFDIGATLVFRPGGGTTASSPVTITISSNTGRSSHLTIYPAIGQVRVQ